MKPFISHLITVIVTSAVWFSLNAEESAYRYSKHQNELKQTRDSLAKCNGLIKEYKKFYPSEK